MILRPDISSTSDTPSAAWKSIHSSCASHLPFAHSSGESEDIDIIYFILATWESLIHGCKKRMEILRFQMSHNIITQPLGTKVVLRTVQMCKVNWSCVHPTLPLAVRPNQKTVELRGGPALCLTARGTHMVYSKVISGAQRQGLFCLCSSQLLLKSSSIYGKWYQFPIDDSDVKLLFKIKYKRGADLKKKLSRWQHK